ncbi:uncharacterized protein LOC124143994 [Haliotis rufescens]|uniref:uncharacterized protein LOC124143994 n=1 Tax=Haliotis rufescens TaxID=6454 RepID=UPI00201FA819|nr:uncharacterized protein LOC124143994 [Haliotis rufescens]
MPQKHLCLLVLLCSPLAFALNLRSPIGEGDETDETDDNETESDDDEEGENPGLSHLMLAGLSPVTEPQEECFNISVNVPVYVEHEDVAIRDGMRVVNVNVLQDNSISGACNYVITDNAIFVNSTCNADFEVCLLPLNA